MAGGLAPGSATGPGTALHHAYITATTATFAGIVTCQVGTAMAARTDHAALRDIGLFTNPLLLAGIAFELAFTALLVYVPIFQGLFGTAALPPDVVALHRYLPRACLGFGRTAALGPTCTPKNTALTHVPEARLRAVCPLTVART